jgi:LAGLIDADG DNA endonuclease family
MDDGYKTKKGFYICTESYSLNEHYLLIKILKSKFDLYCSPHKTTNGYRLYILSTSKEKLINLIKPYILNHFYYKLNLDSKNRV